METNVNTNQLQTIQEEPSGLIALAIQKDIDIEKLERLLALKERHDAQVANKSFIAAMSNFQQQVPEIPKSKQVGYTNRSGGSTSYKYAELGAIDEVIKSAMAANGLSKRWEITEEGDKIICTCIISHVDGHKERTTMSSVKDASGGKNDIQSKASAITYLQRYTLIGALGITTASEDNDGDGTAPPQAMKQQAPAQELPWLNITNKDGSLNQEGSAVLATIAAGTETIESLKTRFKLSKQTIDLLSKPFTNEQPVSEEWYAELNKCKSKEELDRLAISNKETIEANPALKQVFKQYYKALKTATV